MKMKLGVALAATIIIGCSTSPDPEAGPVGVVSFRKQVPQPGPPPELRVPVPERKQLPNGLTFYWVHQPNLPLVRVQMVVRGGSAADPTDKAGLAGFVAEVLQAGTSTRNAVQIASEVEALGSSLEVRADDEHLALGFTSLTPHAAAVMDVLADVVLNPAFAADEIERTRRERTAALAQAMDDPRRVASRVFGRAVFGSHPYGHDVLGNARGIESITRDDLRAYYERYFRPDNAAVIVVGDLDPAMMEQAITARFGAWTGQGEVVAPPAAAPSAGPRLLLVNRPNAPQSQLQIGHLGIARNDPDYFPVLIMNAVLGGMFNSRIMMNLREDKGYTYGARSAFNVARSPGSFYVYSAVRSDATAPAIKEVLAELQRMRSEDVTPEELELAKNSYSLALAGYFQDVQAVARTVSNIHLYELPLDYYRQLPSKVNAVTTADVRRAAEQHLHPDKLQLVVVGDKSLIEEGLRALGRLVPAQTPVADDLPPRTEVWDLDGTFGSASDR